MTHKNFLPLLFYHLSPIVFCLLTGCYSNKQIVIDDSLNTGSERWKAKIKDLPAKTQLALATFFCAVLGSKDL